MKRVAMSLILVLTLVLFSTSCREEDKKKASEQIETTVDDIEEGLENAADEVEEAYEDVKAEIKETKEELEK